MRQIKLLSGILVSCLCVGFILLRVDSQQILSALLDFRKSWFLTGILFLSIGYVMRILRWSILLKSSGATLSFRGCVAPFLGSIALNNILPMRLGDVMRALVFPASMGISRITSTGSLVVERFLDLVTLLVCLGMGLFLYGSETLPHWIRQGIAGFSILIVSVFVLIFLGSARLEHFFGKFRHFVMLSTLFSGINMMSRPRVLFFTILISLIVWTGETGLFWCILKGCHLSATASIAMTVMAVATLSTLVPSSPGYIGSFHLAAYSAITLLNGLPAQAASFALLSHLVIWLTTTLAGLIAILIQPELVRGLKLSRLNFKMRIEE